MALRLTEGLGVAARLTKTFLRLPYPPSKWRRLHSHLLRLLRMLSICSVACPAAIALMSARAEDSPAGAPPRKTFETTQPSPATESRSATVRMMSIAPPREPSGQHAPPTMPVRRAERACWSIQGPSAPSTPLACGDGRVSSGARFGQIISRHRRVVPVPFTLIGADSAEACTALVCDA